MYLFAFVYVYAALLTLVSFTVFSDPYNIDVYIKPGIAYAEDSLKTAHSALFLVGSEGERILYLAYSGFRRTRRGPASLPVVTAQQSRMWSPTPTLSKVLEGNGHLTPTRQVLIHATTVPCPPQTTFKTPAGMHSPSTTATRLLPTIEITASPAPSPAVTVRLLVEVWGEILLLTVLAVLAAVSLQIGVKLLFRGFCWWRTPKVPKRTPSVEQQLGRFLAIRRRVGKINADSRNAETQNRAPPPSTPTKTQPRLSSPVQRAYRSPRTPRTKAQRQELSAMRRRVLLPVSEEAEILARRFPLVGRAPLEPMNINTDGGVYQIGSPVKGPLAG
ncbi:hypothetical protein C8R43DRAFT_1019023 [Mycena crocata]|nr:hypothetical protein C8R43DRAFT_1019023 [Mycena crocata]